VSDTRSLLVSDTRSLLVSDTRSLLVSDTRSLLAVLGKSFKTQCATQTYSMLSN